MRDYREHISLQRGKEVRGMVFGIVALLVLCIISVLVAQTLFPPVSELEPTSTSSITVATITPAQVIESPPTSAPVPTDGPMPTDSPLPANTAAPTEASPPTPTRETTPVATPSPEPLTIPLSDSQADIVFYNSLAPVADAPAGIDIRAASVAPDLRVSLQATEGTPAELSNWAEGKVLLWLALHDPIPDPPAVYTEWLFALDLDGNTATGRPPGSLRINPDLGVEVAIGAFYDPGSGGYALYSLVWDPNQESWADGPGGIHYIISESRTLVGIALPLETLTQSAAQVTGVTVAPEAARGRAAALATVDGQRIIDFYPDRPE